MFFRGSRYENVAETQITDADGRVIKYKRIRFIPDSTGVFPYTVKQGDRSDLIAYQFYRNPEMFWRLCDANLTMKPDDLTDEPGTRITVPIPQGY